MWRVVCERVVVKSPVRENRPPGSVRGAPGNWRPYRDPPRELKVAKDLTLAAGGDTVFDYEIIRPNQRTSSNAAPPHR